MSRQHLIERELVQLEGGAFQKLAEAYIYRRLDLKSITTLGSQPGTNKTTKGTPDAHSFTDCDAILIPFTTAQCDSYKKLKKDIQDCVSTRIPKGFNRRIVCCHLVWRLTAEQEGKLIALDPRVELIGPKTITLDLANKYRDLAADYLHVRMGVDALITPSEWVKREERKGYATPQSSELRQRTKELEELRDALERVRIVVIHGPSGCGKTRLALELVKRYAQDKRVASYVLSKLRGDGVAEDINEFLSEGDAVLLVDDAQQSDGLDELLEVVLKNEGLRVVLTVRDYARGSLLNAVRRSARYEEYPLQPLDNRAVEELVRDNFGINSYVLLEKIGKVARGNLRLAIMAALCAERDGYSGIESAHAVMDLFYKGLIDELDQDDLRLLSYLSVYAPCDFGEGDPAYESLLAEGMTLSEMKRRTRKLHDRNILDVLESPERVIAVKFEQLNLQDYCTYKAIFEEHVIDLYEFITMFVLRDRQRVVRVLNVLISIFGDDETISKIKHDCKQVWMSSGSYSITERREIMEVLHPLIPDDAYRFACNEIGGMPSSNVPISEQGNYGKQVIGEVPVSLAILCELRDQKHYPGAISVLLDGVQKGCFKLSEYKSVIEKTLAITTCSVVTGFVYERRLLEELGHRIADEPHSQNLQFFGLKLCEQYLAFSHSSTEPADEEGIRFVVVRMPQSTPSLALRRSAITFLCTLLGKSGYRIAAARTLRPHVGILEEGEINEEIRFFLEDGIETFALNVPTGYTPVSIEEQALIYHCYLACKTLSLQESKEQMFGLLPLAVFDRERLMESFDPNEEEVLFITKGWDFQRYKEMLRINQEMWDKGELEPYSAGSLIERVFSTLLAQSDSNVNIEEMFEFFCGIQDADREIALGSRIIEEVARRIGWRSLLDQARDHGLAALFSSSVAKAPGQIITADDLDCLIAMARSGKVLLKIDAVVKTESTAPGFAGRYCAAVKDALISKPEYASSFFQPLLQIDNPTLYLDACFSDNLGSLLEIYMANDLQNHFDYFGIVFGYLDEKGLDPVGCLLSQLEKMGDNFERQEIICRLGHASGLQEPKKRMSEVVYRLDATAGFSTYDIGALLVHNNYLAKDFDVQEFVFDELRRGLEEDSIPRCYTTALMYIPFETRVESYIDLLSRDPDGTLFGILPFGSASYVESGAEGFAPAYRAEIRAIRTISESLPKDDRFSYHRGRLHEIIDEKEREIERERWRNFHESI